jgi:peroxin-1
LGIRDGSKVSIKALPDVPEAVGVCVEPVSVDDWEVVERNADYMETQILNQVGGDNFMVM